MALITASFLTDALRRPVTIYIIVPSDKMVCPDEYLPPKRPMKTLYFLEGLTGAANGLVSYSRAQAFAEDYNLCIVAVAGDNKWYADSPISGDYYETMVVQDLLNFTRQTFNLSPKREDTFIGGFSMGAYGAVVCGFNHPELFSHVIIMDAAFNIRDNVINGVEHPTTDIFSTTEYCTMFGLKNQKDYAGSRYDHEALARTLAQSGRAKPRVLMSCGGGDGLLPVNQAYAGLLKNLKFDVTFQIQGDLCHSFAALDAGLQTAMDWLPLDGFRGNVAESTQTQNFGFKEYINWKVYHNIAKP